MFLDIELLEMTLSYELQVKGVVKDAANAVPDPSEAVDKVHTNPSLFDSSFATLLSSSILT